MVCSDPIWENNIKYCYSNKVWFVGDNETTGDSCTAVNSNLDISGTVVIPEFVKGHPITQIARCAFFRCYLITNIIIKAKITVINYRSFSQINNLQTLKLPSTIEEIYYLGIDMYDSNTETHVQQGFTTVIFDTNTHLKYLGEFAFAWRTYIILVINNDMDPIKHNNYTRYTTLLIKSPNLNTFAGIQSEYISKDFYNVLCGKKIHTKCNCINNIHYLLFSMILVFV